MDTPESYSERSSTNNKSTSSVITDTNNPLTLNGNTNKQSSFSLPKDAIEDATSRGRILHIDDDGDNLTNDLGSTTNGSSLIHHQGQASESLHPTLFDTFGDDESNSVISSMNPAYQHTNSTCFNMDFSDRNSHHILVGSDERTVSCEDAPNDIPQSEIKIESTCNSDTNNPYATHKYLLYFLDPEVEQRYYNFQYVDNSFVGGKLLGLVFTSSFFIAFVFHTQPFSNGASYTVESFTSL